VKATRLSPGLPLPGVRVRVRLGVGVGVRVRVRVGIRVRHLHLHLTLDGGVAAACPVVAAARTRSPLVVRRAAPGVVSPLAPLLQASRLLLARLLIRDGI
jgi:hypothetical protein